jgi:uncharacterized secreted protein with C-terminal beta-propeller domain
MREQKAFDILSQAPSAIYMNSKNLFIIDPIRQYNKSNIYQIPLEKIDSWPATLQVTGHLNNQFDIDQYENYLRVGSHNWESDDNLLSILDLSTGATLATIEELGVNEDIYSMEFTDTKVIMVTYRVYDPFYVIDVNDHERPILTTTIKQPGFNSYLKVFNDKVIGLGQMGRWFGNSKLDLFSLPEVQASEKLFSQEFEGYINVHQTNYEASYKSIYLNQDKKHVAFMVHGYNYHSGSYSNKIHFYEINETAVEYKTINLEENGLNLRMFDHEGYFYIITQNSIKKYDPSSYEKISSTNL